MRVLIIDVYAILTAAYEQEKVGKISNAAQSTVKTITELRDGWDVCIAVADAMIDRDHGPERAPSFRAFLDPPRPDPEDPTKRIGYKANRPPREAQFFGRRAECLERLAADGCHVFVAPERARDEKCSNCPGESCPRCHGKGYFISGGSGYYYEADDGIASAVAFLCDAALEAATGGQSSGERFCSQCGEPGTSDVCECGGAMVTDVPGGYHGKPYPTAIRIVSSDKDLAALVDPTFGVDVLSLATGKVHTLESVREAFGVDPPRVPDFLALAGDTSDGFALFRGPMGEKGKRKPGIGPVAAKTLLAKFGDAVSAVEACCKDPAPEGIEPNVIRLIRRAGGTSEPAKMVKLGLQLATLRTDVPLDFSAVLKGPAPLRPLAPTTRHFAEPPKAQAPAPQEPAPATTEPPEVIGEPVPAPVPVVAEARALAVIPSAGLDLMAFQPRSLSELETFAQIVLNSHGYAQFANYEQVMCVIAEAREKAIPMMMAMRSAYFVKGKLGWAAALLGFLAERAAKVFRIVETTSTRAVVEYQRQTDDKPSLFDFTIEEAEKAGWIKADSRWASNPRTMLRWAAIRECARFAFMGAVLGMYTEDELRNPQPGDEEKAS